MKKLLLLLSIITTNLCLGQDLLMQNGTFTACSGLFYDSGGEFLNYSNDEDLTITICPEQSGQRVKLEFFDFLTQINADILTIYDGDSTSADIIGVYSGGASPTIAFAGFDNPTGCLTLTFTSNSSGNTLGWKAEISCLTPCQDITAVLDSTLPIANAEGIIEVCVGDNISLNGSGIFELDGTGASYTWDLGDGNTVSGQNINISYDQPGVYLVNLDIRDTNMDNFMDGCPNTNTINQVIRVSGTPDFTGTIADDATLCFGDTTTIEGVVNPLTLFYNCPPPESEVTFLPDGSGVAYSTSINVTCFSDAQVLTDVNQIESICLNMEHSYLGDLFIDIVSPTGQTVRLHGQGGGSANLGIPWATSQIDGNSGNTTPGTGLDYCFIPNGGVPTLIDGVQSDGTFPIGDTSDTYIDSFIPEGFYSPVESLDGLLGSPLNGEWTIIIVDNIALDNGYIFSWELNFDQSLPLENYEFTPSIVSQSWDADPTITNVNGNIITVAPNAEGEYCYVFRVVDEFGCEYTEEVCVTMLADGESPTTFYEDLDGDGYGDPNSTIEDCSVVPPFGFVLNALDCNDVNSAINPDASDSEGNGVDENCDGIDGVLLSIDEVTDINFEVIQNPFNDRIMLNIPAALNGDNLSVILYDISGRKIFESIYSDIDEEVTIMVPNGLDKAHYFLKIIDQDNGYETIKKLIKM